MKNISKRITVAMLLLGAISFTSVSAQETTGTYKIADGILYSKPEGKLEIAVEINTLTADTLSFTMSRSGNAEILTLVKK